MMIEPATSWTVAFTNIRCETVTSSPKINRESTTFEPESLTVGDFLKRLTNETIDLWKQIPASRR